MSLIRARAERTVASTRRIDPAQESSATPEPADLKPRYDAFDALRGGAMFLVVAVHSAVAYITHDMPSVLWCVRDAPSSSVFDGFCLWAMGISNPLYFAISGFLSVALYDSRGFRGFLAHRTRRLLLPFLVGVVTVLPVCLYVWMYGWFCSGRCTWREILRLRFHDPVIERQRFGAGHLWFLEYLIVLVAAYALIRWWMDRRPDRPERLGRLMNLVLNSPWRVLLLAVPTTAILWSSRRMNGVDAMLDRQISFLIDPTKFLHYGSFFVVGTFLYVYRNALPRIARAAAPYLALSVPVFFARLWYIQRDWKAPLAGWEELAMAASGGLFAWLIVFGLIGLALRLYRTPRQSIRYLADSSYWIYLIHMPILGLIQVDLFRVPGSAFWKFPLVLTATLAIGFASYQTCVRHTRIGRVLHGHRARRSSLATPLSDAKPPKLVNSASNRVGRSA
jgi:surface polysaccharide O-acyltransferase-like enzyme